MRGAVQCSERPIGAGPAPPLWRGCSGCAPWCAGARAAFSLQQRHGAAPIGSQEGPGRSCHPPRVVPATQPTQGVQELVPESLLALHVPWAQSRQELRPGFGWNLPEAQGSHFPQPDPLYVPGAQVAQILARDPLYLPGAQDSHRPSSFSSDLNVPAAQGEHEAE